MTHGSSAHQDQISRRNDRHVTSYCWRAPRGGLLVDPLSFLAPRRIPVSAVREGRRIVVVGTAEPLGMAVSCSKDQGICLAYDLSVLSQGFQGGLKQGTALQQETNAVSFVLNDGTGSIVVLGRRAHWHLSEGEPDESNIDPASLRLIDDPTYSYQRPGAEADDLARGRTTLRSVSFGRTVTVSGQAYRSSAAIVWPSDELDAKTLPSDLVIGPGRFRGLTIRFGR